MTDSSAHLPASQSFVHVEHESYVAVVSQEDLNVTVRSFSPVYEGCIIDFFPVRCSGIVTSVSGDRAEVYLTKNLVVTKGRIRKICQPSVIEILYSEQVDPRDIGNMEVYCSIPSYLLQNQLDNYRPRNSISWTLFYKASNSKSFDPIIEGHDYYTPAVCSVKSEGSWSFGTYTLKASLVDSSFNTLSTKQCSWSVDRKNQKLSAGGLNDVKPPLIFV